MGAMHLKRGFCLKLMTKHVRHKLEVGDDYDGGTDDMDIGDEADEADGYQTRKAHLASRQPGKKSIRGSTTQFDHLDQGDAGKDEDDDEDGDDQDHQLNHVDGGQDNPVAQPCQVVLLVGKDDNVDVDLYQNDKFNDNDNDNDNDKGPPGPLPS